MVNAVIRDLKNEARFLREEKERLENRRPMFQLEAVKKIIMKCYFKKSAKELALYIYHYIR